MSALARFVTGRRTKWVVVGALDRRRRRARRRWAPSSPTSRSDETASFLPEGAESTKVQELLKERFPGGETSIGLIVYQPRGRADGGRQGAHRHGRRRRSTRRSPSPQPAQVPFSAGRAAGPRLRRRRAPPTRSSPCRSTSTRSPTGARRRARSIGAGAGGLDVYVTGDLGLFADFEEVFGELDAKLLLATVLLVLILLGAIYRAPLIAVIPIFVVGALLPGRQRLHLPLRRRRQHGQLATPRASSSC